MTVKDQTIQANGGAELGSYRRLADFFHDVLSEHDPEALLDRLADTVADLIPYDSLTIYRADEAEKSLLPVLARDQWAAEVLADGCRYGEGITGWAAEHRSPVLANQAHLDPRTYQIPGTPDEPEAMISLPLVTKKSVKGVLNIYRSGQRDFSDEEFELAQRFGDAAALALENVESRANLERLAHTDSLTGLYNHRFFQERLRAELTRACRVQDSVALVMIDIDDFKKVNDIYGHGVGDQVLVGMADMLRGMVRGSDIVCRLGGEEFALIMPSCHAGDALGFARRLSDKLAGTRFDPVGRVTVSVGIAQGPEHAMNPRELLACAEGAMMTVKARGKNGVLLYEFGRTERPGSPGSGRSDVRSIAHMKMLQSLSGKLNRLNEIQHIAAAIANELRTLIDYQGCRIYQVEGDYLVPIAVRGDVRTSDGKTAEIGTLRIGEGITGRAALTRSSLLIPNALECEYARVIPGSEDVAESIVAVPLCYGSRALGVIVLSKLGVGQFDEDDVRLLEVLSGQASVAMENARLYEAQRREAESAKALLECADVLAKARTSHAIADETAEAAARLLEARQASLWVLDETTDEFRCEAQFGYVGDRASQPLLRAKVAADAGRAFLEDKKLPFVARQEDIRPLFGLPDGVLSKVCAIAPLHGIKGWILVREPVEGVPHFTEQRLRLLAGISYQTSVAMQKAEFYRQQKENAEIAGALLDFSRELAAAEGIEETLDRIVEQASIILGSPQTVVWLQEADGDLRAAAAWGFEDEARERVMSARFDKQVTRSFNLTEPFVLHATDVRDIPGASELVNATSFAIAPVKLEGGRLGFIASAAPALGDYEFSARKMRLLAGIAHQSVLAINSGASFENLERTFFDTVEALANALEARDEYTSTHARWITDTSIEVGRVLGLDGPGLKRLELGALFHDIGKIGIPNEILQKPGPLTDEEWVIMKTHPELGERILEPIERLEDVRPIVRACHEHFDGSGYPDGLVGEDIPIESRIILVVDAFHAMTTDRVYRAGLPVEEARRRLIESSGTQFDPRVVQALLGLFADRPELTETV